MLLAGIMLKMGIYGLLRFVLPVVPAGVAQWGDTALALCVIGIVYASLIALRQQDLKRLVAYSSIAHVGLIAAGVLSQIQQGCRAPSSKCLITV
jgi:NADH-quinone oxidoreductase subunit M